MSSDAAGPGRSYLEGDARRPAVQRLFRSGRPISRLDSDERWRKQRWWFWSVFVAGIVALVLLYGWIWGTSTEEQVASYVRSVAPDTAVQVSDCVEAQDPERSVVNRHWCLVDAPTSVPAPRPDIARIRTGRRGYCFDVSGGEAVPLTEAPSASHCFRH